MPKICNAWIVGPHTYTTVTRSHISDRVEGSTWCTAGSISSENDRKINNQKTDETQNGLYPVFYYYYQYY
jgi:hypothetical protein